MPQHYTKFNDRWLEEVDSNGHKLKLWCGKGDSDTKAYCFALCAASQFSVEILDFLTELLYSMHKDVKPTSSLPRQLVVTVSQG